MWETNVKACGPQHPEWNASPETKAKSCGPGMLPFKRIKNPIQVNLFGEKQARILERLVSKKRTADALGCGALGDVVSNYICFLSQHSWIYPRKGMIEFKNSKKNLVTFPNPIPFIVFPGFPRQTGHWDSWSGVVRPCVPALHEPPGCQTRNAPAPTS